MSDFVLQGRCLKGYFLSHICDNVRKTHGILSSFNGIFFQVRLFHFVPEHPQELGFWPSGRRSFGHKEQFAMRRKMFDAILWKMFEGIPSYLWDNVRSV
ncbi:hypothetical protein J5N97_005971 [Dioscorea zingiberensis]|uniref:Uncharacterized protein n=1 Tax=Dioscorea zingiberensis TaxID=325984 RepID=A0A9D5HSD4_9LILI|nr:hypothetical protein J5N97_005971 [Dioscorea zingiberensis]